MQQGSRNQNQRKSLVVNWSDQRRIIVDIGRGPLVVLVINVVVVGIFTNQLVVEAANADSNLPSVLPLFLAVLACMMMSSFVLLSQALRISNRVVGPQYRIRKELLRYRQGDQQVRIRLRDRDYLRETAADINELLDWWASSGDGSDADSHSRTETNSVSVDSVASLSVNKSSVDNSSVDSPSVESPSVETAAKAAAAES